MSRAWIFLPLVLLYLVNLGSAGFLGPDEPRYASVGREMARSGDWVTPRLDGSPWFEKAPLVYWTTGAAIRLGLGDEWAARLPLALESLAFLTFFFEVLRREFSLRVATAATAILGTSAGWLAYSFAAIPDLPMSAALAAAMLVGLWDTRPHRGWLAGALLGLAILAKGFLPIALFAPVWLIARGKRLSTVAGAVLVAAPWYLLCLMRNGSAFWDEFFWKHHVQRLISADALQHGQPIWYYAPVLLAGLFPWTPLTLLLARKQALADVRLRFLLLWLLAALLFFSLVPNKLPGYVLPLLPVLAILLAAALDKAPGQAWWMAACAALMMLLPSIAAGLPEAFLNGASRTHWSFRPEGFLFLLAACAVGWLAWRGDAAGAMLAAALVVATGVGYLKFKALPLLDQRDSVRAFWRAHQPQVAEACLDASVSRTWAYGLQYYNGHPIPDCGGDDILPWRVSTQGGVLVVRGTGP